VLVTGSAGFIGSHVVAALLAAGRRVVGVDNFEPFYSPEIKRRAVRDLELGAQASLRAAPGHADMTSPAFEQHELDIRDAHAMSTLFERVRPRSVIHLAAKAGVRPSIADPTGYMLTNVVGTSNVLEAARKAGCSKVIVASSSSVYGNAPKVPFSEDDDVSRPISPYAASKRACELLAHAHWHLTGMPTACLRFFTVYGPRQRPDLAIAMFLEKVARGDTIDMFGDGSSSRDYTFIDDIVAGVLAAEQRIDRFGYRVWNLGGSEPVSLKHMIATIGKVVGVEPIVRQQPMQPGDVERTFADLSRSGKDLGYRPVTSLERGIAEQWAAIQQAESAT
jgi:UDP-glucuronate 4-epimerase